ncbi:MAG: DNA polymerase III subunit gamma/tau [Muribaculaceae bacterium]|nr:DNA polymerase III subunit gamma/tau [Muribaculaceae bacterium]
MSETQYVVSARKYRPATFNSVVGQKNLTDTLKNAIGSRRLAQAYLFCGPRGVGKTSCARIFAKTINCLSPTEDGEACGHCESCRAVEEGNSFNIIELDAASNNSVDDIRSLTEQVNVPPTIGKYRVFIIDEVHMLSSQAFNAFLKTLEEPPSYVVFILATTEKHKVIPTILSRCQIYDFKRITIQDMVEHLQHVASLEGIEADVPSLNVIAKKADGAMRDALSIFDQVAASSFGHINYESTIASLNVLDYEYYFRLVDAFRDGDVPEALMIYKEIRDHGFDSLFFINGLAAHVRDLMVAFSPRTAALLEVADDVAARYTEQARQLPVNWHYAALKLLNDCDVGYRTSSNKQLLVELTLIRLCQLLNPPTPPFDRVEGETISLRPPKSTPVIPPSSPVSSSSIKETASAESPSPPQSPTVTHTVEGAKTEAKELPEAPAQPSTEHVTPKASGGIVRGRRQKVKAFTEGVTSDGDSLQHHRDAVTPEGFMAAWQDYINRNLEKKILISAMRKATPVQTEAETFKVVVDHPASVQAFEQSMTNLITHLRTALKNDFITLSIEIDDSAKVDNTLPPSKLLQDIADQNPEIARFLTQIDAEID